MTAAHELTDHETRLYDQARHLVNELNHQLADRGQGWQRYSVLGHSRPEHLFPPLPPRPHAAEVGLYDPVNDAFRPLTFADLASQATAGNIGDDLRAARDKLHAENEAAHEHNARVLNRGDETGSSPDEDTCRSMVFDGTPVVVRASGTLTPTDERMIGEVVEAAKRRFASEPPTIRQVAIDAVNTRLDRYPEATRLRLHRRVGVANAVVHALEDAGFLPTPPSLGAFTVPLTLHPGGEMVTIPQPNGAIHLSVRPEVAAAIRTLQAAASPTTPEQP